MQKATKIILIILVFLALGGCITSVDETLPYDELPEITLATEVSLVASPSDPASYLSSDSIPAGKQVSVVGIDENAAWLLVLSDNRLGWMPSIFSRSNIGTLTPPIVVEPLSSTCSKYLGAMFDPEEEWVSNSSSSVIVLGSIYRPKSAELFEDASLAIEIDGSDSRVTADYIHTPLTSSSAVVLFGFSVEDLQKGSRVSFDLTNPGDEPLSFQAAFFSNTCPDTLDAAEVEFTDQLPVGKTKVVVAEQRPSSQPPSADSSDVPAFVKIDHIACTPTVTYFVLSYDPGDLPNYYYYNFKVETSGSGAVIEHFIPVIRSELSRPIEEKMTVTLAEETVDLSGFETVREIADVFAEMWERQDQVDVTRLNIAWYEPADQPPIKFVVFATHPPSAHLAALIEWQGAPNQIINQARIPNVCSHDLSTSETLVIKPNSSSEMQTPAGIWECEWRNPEGHVYSCELEVLVSSTNRVYGSITWVLETSPRLSELFKVDMTAVEYFRGTYNPENFSVEFEGQSKDDPNEIIGLDKYRLYLSTDGMILEGETHHHGDWLGRFKATRIN